MQPKNKIFICCVAGFSKYLPCRQSTHVNISSVRWPPTRDPTLKNFTKRKHLKIPWNTNKNRNPKKSPFRSILQYFLDASMYISLQIFCGRNWVWRCDCSMIGYCIVIWWKWMFHRILVTLPCRVGTLCYTKLCIQITPICIRHDQSIVRATTRMDKRLIWRRVSQEIAVPVNAEMSVF